MTKRIAALATFLFFCALACFNICSAQSAAWKGRLVYNFSGDIKSYDFALKTDKTLFQKGLQPFVATGGEIYFLNDAFPKGQYLVRKYTTTQQFRDVLDMSPENADYKQALEEYSIIRGTGISGILSGMSDPRLSPNGKYLSVTIFGYPGQAFTKNCVAVFDVATKKLVKKWEDKYYGSWTPDGRVLMTGAHKGTSSNGMEYKATTPGIYITDASFSTLSRIDNELDDPSPYHAAVSPDGKKIAFVLNNHIWLCNIDGSGLKQLTSVDRDNIETYPTWSPDGKYIACWVYKTFERSYYTAIAIVPAGSLKPVALTDKAPVWPRDTKGYRISGGTGQLSWR